MGRLFPRYQHVTPNVLLYILCWAPSEPAIIQSEIDVEDDFVDEFREEQQQQLVLNSEQEMEEEEDLEEAQGEEMADEQLEDTEAIHEETEVGHESRDARPAEKLTPVSG